MKILKIILVLLAIVLLISIISPKVISMEQICFFEQTSSRMSRITEALKMFKLDNGTYPSTKEGLKALVKNLNPKKYPNYAKDAYLDKLPTDSWKNPFIYIHYKTEKGDAFQLISFGADGKYGGEGEDEDIVYPPIKKRKLGFFEWFFQK